MEEQIIELIYLAKNTAPELWRIALQQVNVILIKNLIIEVLIVVAIFGIGVLIKKWKQEDIEGVGECAIFVQILLYVCFVGVFMEILEILLNPEYLAIKVLLDFMR